MNFLYHFVITYLIGVGFCVGVCFGAIKLGKWMRKHGYGEQAERLGGSAARLVEHIDYTVTTAVVGHKALSHLSDEALDESLAIINNEKAEREARKHEIEKTRKHAELRKQLGLD